MRIYTMIFALLCAISLQAQNSPKTIKAKLDRVTVFFSGAQMYSAERVTLSPGSTDIIWEGVSPQVQPESVQATASGNDAAVMDVQYHLRYAEVAATKPDDPARKKLLQSIKMLADSITELGFDEKALTQAAANLQTERAVVVNNRMTRGDYKRDSLVLLKESMDYLRGRLSDIDGLLLQNQRAQYRLGVQKGEMQQRMSNLQLLLQGNYNATGDSPEPTPQIIVTIYSEKPITTDITIQYFVGNAGWTASYDLRAKSSDKDVELNHKAQVWQNTGLDWKDVPLTLSTGDPNQNSVKPTLQPYYLTFNPPYAAYQGNREKRAQAPMNSNNNDNTLSEVAVIGYGANKQDRDGVQDYTVVTENLLRVEYEIKLRYTIKNDGKPHNVVIQQKKLPASFNYAAVPKLDPDVFLMARVTEWEDLNLIPGEARLFFDGTYVGETTINPNSTSDTLQLNLGRDKSIVMKRIKLKDKSKEKTFGDTREVTQTYEITIRNTKNLPIRMIVEDQMPISQDADIKIEYNDYDKARFNENTGKLTWDFKIDSKDTRKCTFSYTVKMPKDRPVFNL
jgi:uncharacterized protein (TIGR02231 family)